MTTDPGDLVLDPTCGSGTTAYVAEQWGRRWITIDTSRVAAGAGAAAAADGEVRYYQLRELPETERTERTWLTIPGKGCIQYKTVPHITLKSIAQNTALDPIFAKHEPILAEKLAALNAALTTGHAELAQQARRQSCAREAEARGQEVPSPMPTGGAGSYSPEEPGVEALGGSLRHRPGLAGGSAERRRRTTARPGGRRWTRSTPASPPTPSRKNWSISRRSSAGVVRVTGPFTVEARPAAGDVAATQKPRPFGGEPEEIGERSTTASRSWTSRAERRGLSRQDGRACSGRTACASPTTSTCAFRRLEPSTRRQSVIHAEGEMGRTARRTRPEGDAAVGVVFGPQYGPVTA